MLATFETSAPISAAGFQAHYTVQLWEGFADVLTPSRPRTLRCSSEGRLSRPKGGATPAARHRSANSGSNSPS